MCFTVYILLFHDFSCFFSHYYSLFTPMFCYVNISLSIISLKLSICSYVLVDQLVVFTFFWTLFITFLFKVFYTQPTHQSTFIYIPSQLTPFISTILCPPFLLPLLSLPLYGTYSPLRGLYAYQEYLNTLIILFTLKWFSFPLLTLI